ncbi:hypothetical protein ABKN59_010712 [Abortiporus biennis]
MPKQPPAALSPQLQDNSTLPLTRKRSSLISNASGPHTPTGVNAPLPTLFGSNSNRYSTDSWDSSNYDLDELEPEWKSEHLRLIKRTLDALPSHLLTPFNGPVPPSNLLDKIARGLTNAKGPIDWPHSIRATRAKVVELARCHAKSSSDSDNSDTIAEEEPTGPQVPLHPTASTGPKRPLYRQSSMDFMQSDRLDIANNTNIRRLSRRLQKTDRLLTSPPLNRYAHSSRASSPAFGSSRTPSLNPSTPSSTTLNSTNSGSNRCPVDPRVQRLKRAETFSGSSPFLASRSLKRAPSFGSSRNSLDSSVMSVDFSSKDSDVTSDEEEKLRGQKAKKARTKASSPTPTSPPTTTISPLPSSPMKRASRSRPTNKSPSKNTFKGSPSIPTSKPTGPMKRKANLRRNPSIIGPELPNPQPNLPPPASNRSPHYRSGFSSPSPKEGLHFASPALAPPATPSSPAAPKSLKRTKPSSMARRAPARKISFGSLLPVVDDHRLGGGAGSGLGSAFQLQ